MNSSDFRRGILLEKYRNIIIKEIFRKTIHLCSAFVPFFLEAAYLPAIAGLSAVLVLYCVSEFFRIKNVRIPVIAGITEIAARKRDENKFVLGPVTLVLGIILTALLWPPEAARIGIYALAFGDGLASLAGKLFGRVYIPFTGGKTCAGSLSCFIAVFVSSFSVCASCRAAFVLAVTAMLVEIAPMKDFDNIVIPVLIGGAARLLLAC